MDRWRNAPRNALFPWLQTLPVCALVSFWLWGNALWLMGAALIACVLAVCIVHGLPNRLRILAWVLLCGGALALGISRGWETALGAGICVAVFSFALLGIVYDQVSGMAYWGLGVAAYIVAWIVAWSQQWEALRDLIGYLGVAYLLALVFFMNLSAIRYALRDPEGKRRTISRAMLPANWAMVALLFVGILGIANIETLRRWAQAAMMAVVRAIVAVLAWLSPELEGGSGVAPGEASMLPLMEQGEPSLFWQIMEWVFGIIAGVLLLWVLSRLAVKLWQVLQKAMRRLGLWTHSMQRDVGYVDERISLRDEDRRAQRTRKLALRNRKPRWASLDARGRVRAAFAQVQRLRAQKEPDYWLALPSDVLSPGAPTGKAERGRLLNSYLHARYGLREISREEEENAHGVFE